MSQEKVMVKFLAAWAPSILCMGLIFFLSSLPAQQVTISQTDWIERNLKNFLHMVQYAVLWLLQLRAYTLSGMKLKKAVRLTWITVILFALSDEYHQQFTSGRESSLGDILFDILGMCAAYLAVFKLKFKFVDKLLAEWNFKG